jgi:hypothetical protein
MLVDGRIIESVEVISCTRVIVTIFHLTGGTGSAADGLGSFNSLLRVATQLLYRNIYEIDYDGCLFNLSRLRIHHE